MKQIINCLMSVVMVLMFSGCASKTWQAQPEFNPADVKRIGVVVPSVTVKMIDIGNDVTVDQDLSVTARVAVEKGAVEALKERGFEAFLLTNKEDVVTFQKGYGLLAGELPNHFPKNGVPTKLSKIEGFDQIRKNSKLDCVVAINGLDHKSTAGRKAKMAGLALLGISGGQGLTFVNYNMFCGEDGKPMFSDSYAKSSDITNVSNVSDIVGGLVDNMKAVTPTM